MATSDKEMIDVLRGILRTLNEMKAIMKRTDANVARLHRHQNQSPVTFGNLPPPRHINTEDDPVINSETENE